MNYTFYLVFAIFSLLGIVFGGIAFYLLNSAVFSVLIIIPSVYEIAGLLLVSIGIIFSAKGIKK